MTSLNAGIRVHPGIHPDSDRERSSGGAEWTGMYFGRNTLLYQGGEKPERRQGDPWEAKAEGLPGVEGGRGSGSAGLCRGLRQGGPAKGFGAPQVRDGAGSLLCHPAAV